MAESSQANRLYVKFWKNKNLGIFDEKYTIPTSWKH